MLTAAVTTTKVTNTYAVNYLILQTQCKRSSVRSHNCGDCCPQFTDEKTEAQRVVTHAINTQSISGSFLPVTSNLGWGSGCRGPEAASNNALDKRCSRINRKKLLETLKKD